MDQSTIGISNLPISSEKNSTQENNKIDKKVNGSSKDHEHQREQSIDQPIPLSFPSILINPRLKHLSRQFLNQPKKQKLFNNNNNLNGGGKFGPEKTVPIGKRRQQRVENANFASNPHVTKPSPKDFQLSLPDHQQPKFPLPPPKGFKSPLMIPSVEKIKPDPVSSSMGAFNRSLRGIHRNLKKLINSDPNLEPDPIEKFLIIVDEQLSDWVSSNNPQSSGSIKVWKKDDLKVSNSAKVINVQPWPEPLPSRNEVLNDPENDSRSDEPSIVELSRSPHMLTWDVPNSFGRYLVHCVARYYRIVSYTRQTNRNNNPNRLNQGPEPQAERHRKVVCMVKAHYPTRRGRRVDGYESLNTPPYTDIDSELSASEAAFLRQTIPTTNNGEGEDYDEFDESSDSASDPEDFTIGKIKQPTVGIKEEGDEDNLVDSSNNNNSNNNEDGYSVCSSMREDDDQFSTISSEIKVPSKPSKEWIERISRPQQQEPYRNSSNLSNVTVTRFKKTGNHPYCNPLNQIGFIDWIRN